MRLIFLFYFNPEYKSEAALEQPLVNMRNLLVLPIYWCQWCLVYMSLKLQINSFLVTTYVPEEDLR